MVQPPNPQNLEIYDTVDGILKEDASRSDTVDPKNKLLYTGTTVESFNSKLDDSNEILTDPEGKKLWFTPQIHDSAFSAVYYANESLKETSRSDETPAIVEWAAPQDWIEEDFRCDIPDDKYIVSRGEAEYMALEIPLDALNGYLRPGEGRRLTGSWELDPEGWEFVSYDNS